MSRIATQKNGANPKSRYSVIVCRESRPIIEPTREKAKEEKMKEPGAKFNLLVLGSKLICASKAPSYSASFVSIVE